MKKYLAVLFALCTLVRSASAHRLDEYLQATILTLEPNRITGTMRLVPGVAVAPAVLRLLQMGADGTLSVEQQRTYANRVLADVKLSLDGRELVPRLLSCSIPSAQAMREGTGEILITFETDTHVDEGPHELRFENRHERAISVYLVNVLQPERPELSIQSQSRSPDQSQYSVRFERGASRATATPRRGWSGFHGAFLLGARHIAEGTDHLLFLLTLLLPAPLLARCGRWLGHSGVRHSLMHILGIVTAFTLGHSLTLALAAAGLVRLPSGPVEILIAVSILLSAVHAMRPLFPGREAVVAASFGLVHGLAFASALNELGVSGWYRLVSLLGFNLGIEAMQLAVVVVTLPSLLLWSRVRSYRWCRMGGACVAALAAAAWIAERTTGRWSNASAAIEVLARHGMWIAATLFLCALIAWRSSRTTLQAGRVGSAEP